MTLESVEEVMRPVFAANDITPPASPLGPGYRFDDLRDDSDSGDSNGEINAHKALHDDDSHDISDGYYRTAKHSSIDDYTAKSSKSTSKDLLIADDIQDDDEADMFGVGRQPSDDFDPDIDLGDYDWTMYSSKRLPLNATHSDDTDIVTPEISNSKSLLIPKGHDTRPMSAHSASNSQKEKVNFFAEERIQTNHSKHVHHSTAPSLKTSKSTPTHKRHSKKRKPGKSQKREKIKKIKINPDGKRTSSKAKALKSSKSTTAAVGSPPGSKSMKSSGSGKKKKNRDPDRARNSELKKKRSSKKAPKASMHSVVCITNYIIIFFCVFLFEQLPN